MRHLAECDRALPTEVQDEARRRGLIPDIEDRRAA